MIYNVFLAFSDDYHAFFNAYRVFSGAYLSSSDAYRTCPQKSFVRLNLCVTKSNNLSYRKISEKKLRLIAYDHINMWSS